MNVESQKRNQILDIINGLSNDKLDTLIQFINSLKSKSNIKKPKQILEYAGSWKDIEDSIYNELTVDLIEKRQKNRSRIDE